MNRFPGLYIPPLPNNHLTEDFTSEAIERTRH